MTNLSILVGHYNTDAKCRELLERIRWPSGVACIRCGSLNVSDVSTRDQFDCND